tara:strand:+ start:293 stop:424 length:132 start_codon:yes stop_codon:yes gene_type:complete
MQDIQKEISILKEILQDSILSVSQRIAIRGQIAQLRQFMASSL